LSAIPQGVAKVVHEGEPNCGGQSAGCRPHRTSTSRHSPIRRSPPPAGPGRHTGSAPGRRHHTIEGLLWV